MKAPIALAMIVLGITVGYLVITGKLPNPTAAVSTPTQTPTSQGPQSGPISIATGGTGGGPYVAPRMRY